MLTMYKARYAHKLFYLQIYLTWYVLLPHFTDEETEGQRGEINYVSSRS